MTEALRRSAREIFSKTLSAIEVERVVRSELRLEGSRLQVGESAFDLDRFARVTLIAMGKAAEGMARAAQSVLGVRVTRGLIVTQSKVDDLGACWESVCAGHPVPDAGSVRGAERALELVRASDTEDDLIIFMISGGASAMLESPLDASVSLEDLQSAHDHLVTCGAVIAEMNIVRRRMSSVKGGRLAAAAPKATQLSLLISDVNAGDLATIASGPTLPDPSSDQEFEAVMLARNLAEALPRTVLDLLRRERRALVMPSRRVARLVMSDQQALMAAERHALELFDVVITETWEELPVDALAHRIVDRLRSMVKDNPGRSVCFLSAGESICPVRGAGQGGRNQELALRVASLLTGFGDAAFLAAGTDGIDGNSPAAGAVVDEATVSSADASGLSLANALAKSDSFTLFDRLGATVMTGATGNNVRDLWIAVAGA